VTQRAAVKSTKAKLAAKDPADRSIKGTLSRRSQKGAVTKANKALAAAQQSGRVRLSGRSGVLRPGKGGAKKAAASPARQPMTMEQRKTRLLQVHGKAMERDLSAKKGISRRQVRDILDAGSADVVVRNVKKWVGRNRGSAAPVPKASKPKAPPNRNAAILKTRAKQLRAMKRNGASRLDILVHQNRTTELRNEGLGVGVRRR
jgi:hypothetical protein